MKNPCLQLQFLSQPTDVNFGGNVHGGKVMSWIDLAAYACASAWCEQACVTVYVGGIRFINPIKIPDLVQVKARIIHTGTTSMHIAVDVYAKGVRASTFRKTTHCIIVFVAIGENGKPASVPPFIPQTEEEIRFEQYAKKLMNLRQTIDREMRPFLEQ